MISSLKNKNLQNMVFNNFLCSCNRGSWITTTLMAYGYTAIYLAAAQ